MGYQALLFCPDEKTARTVTQILGELEFSVEACLEPFAAVKKLMSQHFDAVVVDCDNEQNATLLFKSARNSTSNQASLAVAVVEGQAGVAKAFRIGANLVLTKPINIEQSKGTLRVARGLLRKGEPAKAGVPAATAPAPAAAKPIAAKPAAPARPAAPPAAAAPRPATPIVARPAAAAVPAKAAVASSAPASHNPAAHSEVLPEIKLKDPVSPAPPPPAPRLGSQAASIETTSGFRGATSAAPPSPFGSGAASAPAPARETQAPPAPAVSPASSSAEADILEIEPRAEAATSESHSSHAATTSFTFGGANVPEQSSGGKKKILLGVAAAALVAAGLYAGWTYFQGRASQPSQTIPAPVSTPASHGTAAIPVSPAPKPAVSAPSTLTSSSSSSAQPAVQPPADSAASPTSNDAEDNDSDAGNSGSSAPAGAAKSSSSASSKASKAEATKPEAAPRVVKGGSAPAVHAAPAAPDTPAPNLIGIATPGSGAPPPNLVSGSANVAQPVLQTLNISQGVSQGLLIKKVQPLYPRNALTMHVEGEVELMATVSAAGNITTVKVVSGDQLLTKAAIDAVKQWKYKPYLLNGQPVEIQTQVTVNFKLPH